MNTTLQRPSPAPTPGDTTLIGRWVEQRRLLNRTDARDLDAVCDRAQIRILAVMLIDWQRKEWARQRAEGKQ